MLDRLIDLAREFFELFLFVEVVDEYQRAIVLRWGRFSRELEPGAHFYWPFRIERVLGASVVPDATELDEQTFSLRDGATVAVRPVLTYRVRNVKKFLLEVEDARGSLLDAVAGAIRRYLAPHAWEELIDPERGAAIEEQAVEAIRKEANRWGVEVLRVQFPDLVKLDAAVRLFGSRERRRGAG